MNHLIIFLLQFIFFFLMGDVDVKAQTLSDNTEPTQPQGTSLTNNFQPSLAVVIGMLAVMFSLTFVLLLYAKFCHRASSTHSSTSHRIQNGLVRTRTTSSLPSGVDKIVIESLPFFRFSSLKGSKEGLECSVCLAKFLDVEILRLLPKCKHAFHMDCIDQWLEKHSTCPLCRRKVSADDLSQLPFSSSFRFLFNAQSESSRDHDSSLELYVEREASRRHGSSRFSSFRKTQIREDELPIQLQSVDGGDDVHHKFNHKINVVSDVVLRNRWSDVTSADLVFLNSELLGDVSSARFSSLGNTNEEMMMVNSFKAEMERKREFESKIREINTTPSSSSCSKQGGFESKALNSCGDKRSMSEIIHHPRLITELSSDIRNNSSSIAANSAKEERIRKLWLPIARKTAQCFANRQRLLRPPQS